MEPIAYIETPFDQKFGIPRQSGMAATPGRVVFYPKYRIAEMVRGLESYDYLWLIWRFETHNVWHPTVRPPRLGGNQRLGVLATRSPFRPNPIGLSSVKLQKVTIDDECGPMLHVIGVDLRNHTEIYDIKPYLSYTDCHPNVQCGIAKDADDRILEILFDDSISIDETFKHELRQVLSHDPRPRYQNDKNRIYSMSYAGYQVRFSIDSNCMTILSVEPTFVQTSD